MPASAEDSLDSVIELLEDPETPSQRLRALAEDHELNPACGRDCPICREFFEIEFEHPGTNGPTMNFIGEAIVSHPQCDPDLRDRIKGWVYSLQDGEWSRGIDEAIAANPHCAIDVLEAQGKWTSNPFELFLIKHHPALPDAIAASILSERGWTEWPDDDYLTDDIRYIINDDDRLRSIQAPTTQSR